ncbi:PREDICTED: centrosomal protein kizuna-like isoform X2 [Branchiostoma belcheri]|uniref:Centrosomal protein kizuna n=1 Tax=Branchiostoma belcheri TaxID=7741 RepID=A0A6P5AGK5_BRABE|nr:PREDICTED: centrosomal protein kizuna-like isoform X2 [Branchiostoma belcheri]
MATSNVEFYAKLQQLQDQLHASEERRLQLERQMNSYMKSDKRLARLRASKLQAYWTKLCEDEQKSRVRNEQLLKDFNRVESHVSMLSARTDRLRELKKQYEAHIERLFPRWREQLERKRQEKLTAPKNQPPQVASHDAKTQPMDYGPHATDPRGLSYPLSNSGPTSNMLPGLHQSSPQLEHAPPAPAYPNLGPSSHSTPYSMPYSSNTGLPRQQASTVDSPDSWKMHPKQHTETVPQWMPPPQSTDVSILPHSSVGRGNPQPPSAHYQEPTHADRRQGNPDGGYESRRPMVRSASYSEEQETAPEYDNQLNAHTGRYRDDAGREASPRDQGKIRPGASPRQNHPGRRRETEEALQDEGNVTPGRRKTDSPRRTGQSPRHSTNRQQAFRDMSPERDSPPKSPPNNGNNSDIDSELSLPLSDNGDTKAKTGPSSPVPYSSTKGSPTMSPGLGATFPPDSPRSAAHDISFTPESVRTASVTPHDLPDSPPSPASPDQSERDVPLSMEGLLVLLDVIEEALPRLRGRGGLYGRGDLDPELAREIIEDANSGGSPHDEDPGVLSAVVSQELPRVTSALPTGCLLTDKLLSGRMALVDDVSVRSSLYSHSVPLWDRLVQHFTLLVRRGVMEAEDIADVFSPLLIKPGSTLVQKAAELLAIVVQGCAGNQTLADDQGSEESATSSASLPIPSSPDPPRDTLHKTPPLNLTNSTGKRAPSRDTEESEDEGDSFFDNNVPLTDTAAYQSLMRSSLQQQPAAQLSEEELEGDSDLDGIEAALSPHPTASTVRGGNLGRSLSCEDSVDHDSPRKRSGPPSPRSPLLRQASHEDSSVSSSPTQSPRSPVGYVPSAMERSTRSMGSTGTEGTATGPKRPKGFWGESDDDVDDLAISTGKQDQSGEDDDFDFYG